MPALTTLIIVLLIALCLSFLVMLILIGFVVFTWKQLRDQYASFKKISDRADDKVEEILGEASQESREMIEAAEQRTTALIDELPELQEHLDAKAKKTLTTMLSWQEKEIKVQSEVFHKTVHQHINASLTEFNKHLQSVLDKTAEELSKSLGQKLASLDASTKAMMGETKKEIDQFKKQQQEELGQRTDKVIATVAKRVLGKQLTPQDQHALVMKELERAWEQGEISA